MVVFGGVEKCKVVWFSTLQSQVNGNILDFLLFSHEFMQQLDCNLCGNTNEGCDGYNND